LGYDDTLDLLESTNAFLFSNCNNEVSIRSTPQTAPTARALVLSSQYSLCLSSSLTNIRSFCGLLLSFWQRLFALALTPVSVSFVASARAVLVLFASVCICVCCTGLGLPQRGNVSTSRVSVVHQKCKQC